MILMEMMLEVVIGVLVMEVDKVADEVNVMEVDKVADMKIPIEDFTEWLIINDTYGGDVREIVVLIMEVDMMVDEVTDMEIDK